MPKEFLLLLAVLLVPLAWASTVQAQGFGLNEARQTDAEELIDGIFDAQGNLTAEGARILNEANKEAERIPELAKMLFGNERINVKISFKSGRKETIGLVLQNSRATGVKLGRISGETMEVAIKEETIRQIISSKSPENEFVGAIMDGRIQVKAKSLGASITLGIFSIISSIKSFLESLFAAPAGPVAGPASTSQVVCGDELVSGTEECDTGNLGGKTCLDFNFTGGILECSMCEFNTSRCVRQESLCGNGIIDPNEECDLESLNNQTCQTLGYTIGSLSCNADCTFNKGRCATLRTETYSVGETISGLKGAGALSGQNVSIKFDEVFQTSPGAAYEGRFELYDNNGEFVDSAVARPATFLSEIFRSQDGRMALETRVYISVIRYDPTEDRATVRVVIQQNA